jgi:malonyl-CoA/methylmalonyl-CoA synthetase
VGLGKIAPFHFSNFVAFSESPTLSFIVSFISSCQSGLSVDDALNENFFALIEARFPGDRGTPCLETPGGLAYTWDDVDRVTSRYANLLQTLNLAPASRIVVQIDKSPDALFFYLATLRAGHVFVPLNIAYRAVEVDYFLANAEPTVVVCRPCDFHWVSALGKRFAIDRVLTLGAERDGTLFERAARQPESFATIHRTAGDLAVIIYTSGTTGRSKGAMLTHGNLSSSALALRDFWGFTDSDVLLHALPIFHVHGLFIAAHPALLGRSHMIWLERFEARSVIQELPRATVFMGVPTYYSRLLAEPGLNRAVCESVRLFTSGSAPLSAETFHQFRTRTGHTILERYGMSETSVLTSNPFHHERGERIAGTVGIPLPGVSVRVVDDSGALCPNGKIGHVQVKGPNVFSGYWRLPELSQSEFTEDGWFKTGDLGRFGGSSGEKDIPETYLTLVGRTKDLIISGGYNVYPKEVEGYLNEMRGVMESAVVGVPDDDFGEAVVAAVVPQADANLDEAEMIRTLKTQIARFKVPKHIYFVKELPRNVMGKVQKDVLRASLQEPR